MRKIWKTIFGTIAGKREAQVDELMQMHAEAARPGIQTAKIQASAAKALMSRLQKEVTKCPH